jgi:glycosyltransferase involved in cell wall biosynthesis
MVRLMVVQYAGDYLEAHRRLQDSGTETYYGHHYVLEQLGRIGHEFGEAAILCCKSLHKYNTTLPSGLIVMGAGADPRWAKRAITQLLGEYDPTHLVVLGPLTGILRWGVATNRRVLGLFADSFQGTGLWSLIKYGRLATVLNDQRVEWIANHSINACLSVKKIGVVSDKIIPWDWPHVRQPKDAHPKVGPGSGVPTLVFVGAVIKRKGIGDVIAAVAELKRRGVPVALNVIGAGEHERFKVLAERSNVGPDVRFLGLIPNNLVLQFMKDASIVVIPSQHAYPEGLPLTIYESLCARTPIVASDHPMFARRLVHRVSAMIYRAGEPAELAACIEELLTNQPLYRSLSAAAQDTWERLQLPVKWGELLYRWVSDRTEDRRWLLDHRLKSGRYAAQIGMLPTT